MDEILSVHFLSQAFFLFFRLLYRFLIAFQPRSGVARENRVSKTLIKEKRDDVSSRMFQTWPAENLLT